MKQSENRLRLKIKKKDTSATLKNSNTLNVPGQKRCNPFFNQSTKKLCSENTWNEKSENSEFLSKLDSVESSDWSVDKTECIVQTKSVSIHKTDGNNTETDEIPEETREWKYASPLFPLDWSVKQKIQLISKQPLSFCSSIKLSDKAEGLKKFASNDNEPPHFYQYLCNWIHPLIPSVPNFPLKKTFSEKTGLKDDGGTTSVINGNPLFQEAILQKWKISFQSLFNMLKSNLCSYFYVCGHQFSLLFKGRKVTQNNMKLILTPSTKGLRSMLAEEDISYIFTCNDEPNVTGDVTIDNDKNGASEDDSEYDADSFLNSLGLNKDQHFPNMEEQRKLNVKSELRRLDNRPESTIEITDVQGFVNFFINSPLLCAPSGRMIGIPPTLISPVVFEGASCHVNKYNCGKIRQKSKFSETFLHCLDVYGFILPTQLKGIIDLQLQSSSDMFTLRTKEYENLFAFNTKVCQEEGAEKEFIHQPSQWLPDQNEMKFEDQLFKF